MLTRTYGTIGAMGSRFANHRPELKSVNSVCPFHGIAFMRDRLPIFPECDLIRRSLLSLAFVPALMAAWQLAQLPTMARNNGAGDGSWWTSAMVAVLLACVALSAGLMTSWRLENRGSRLAALIPLLATVIVVSGRPLAAQGGPAEMYLLDDSKLWILFLGAAMMLCAVAAAMPVGERTVGDSRADR